MPAILSGVVSLTLLASFTVKQEVKICSNDVKFKNTS